MNKRRLMAVAKRILKEPNKYDQNIWIEERKCGTAACIGGWATIMFLGQDAEDSLGLTDLQSRRLFDTACGNGWPKKFGDAYYHAKSHRGRARVAYNRILHFIKTGGAE